MSLWLLFIVGPWVALALSDWNWHPNFPDEVETPAGFPFFSGLAALLSAGFALGASKAATSWWLRSICLVAFAASLVLVIVDITFPQDLSAP
jgi:hypothetical protein